MYICIDSRRHGTSDVVDLTVDTGEIVDLTSSCNNNNSVVRNCLNFYIEYNFIWHICEGIVYIRIYMYLRFLWLIGSVSLLYVLNY